MDTKTQLELLSHLVEVLQITFIMGVLATAIGIGGIIGSRRRNK